VFFRTKKSGDRSYLQIVENRWEDGGPRQRVIATLGRLDELQRTGALDSLLSSGAKFATHSLLISEYGKDQSLAVAKKRIGIPLVFERLWEQTGCKAEIGVLVGKRKFEFDMERVAFMTVLHRLSGPGSDRSAELWRRDCRIEGVDELELHQVYRAMAWLGEELKEAQQDGGTKQLSRRCTKDLIEEGLFARRRDLFTSLDLVFFDTTSIYFEGEGGQTLGQNGNSKDKRPDLKQMVVGAVLDDRGNPVCCEMWPGNTTDVKTLVPVASRLSNRFGIGQVCIVADRGMVSAKTIRELEVLGWKYILGARMRKQKEVCDKVLARAGRFQVVRPKGTRSKDPSPLKVKEVWLDDRRYVVCLNEDQAKKDAADREAILASLKEQLRRGDKSLVGNKGYRKFIKTVGERFQIDPKKAELEVRFDGKWVLRTNTQFDAAQVALKYKQLWVVEDIFRAMKSLLETRPIYHRNDETIRGHVFCSFLALVLRKELQDRLETKGLDVEWADVIRDLDQLQEIEMKKDGKRFLIRTESKGCCGKVFQTVGVAMPPTVRQVRDS